MIGDLLRVTGIAGVAARLRTGLADPEFRKLSVLIATSFIDMIGFAMVFPLLPFYALKLNATPEVIGVITASFSVAQLASAPLWGWVSDHYGRRPALLVGLTASAIAYVVFGFATSIWLLLASRLIQGAGGGTTGVAQAYVSDSITPARRAQALGWLSAATSLGVAIGPALGSWSVTFGSAGPGLVAAALCLLNVWFTWRWLPESRVAAAPGTVKARRPIWGVLRNVVRHPGEPVSRLILIYGAGMLGFAAMTSVFALFLDAKFGITEKTIGLFFVFTGVLSFVMRAIVLGPAVRRLGEVGAMRLGTVSLVIGLVAYPLMPTVWTLLLVMPLVPIGTALLFPATTALMSRSADPALVGTTLGVAQTAAGTARVVAPLMATSAFQRLGVGAPFFLAAAIVGGVGVVASRLSVALAGPAERAG
ncbi:MAG: MFS transporter [Gemmatimonadales bacterium]